MKVKLIVGFLLIIGCLNNAYSQPAIVNADSLFNQNKYTEAFDQYKELFKTQQASPAMLLKMAFIQEGLDNYAEALYYLNIYYNLTVNKKVLTKMREIAEKQNLDGYEYYDIEFFQNLLLKYKSLIIGCISALVIVLLFYMYQRQKKKEEIGLAITFQVILLICLFMVSNQFFLKNKAIIGQDRTILMSGPSAGAEPMEIITKGHRVIVLEEQDAWIKIRWNDSEAYVRKNKLILI